MVCAPGASRSTKLMQEPTAEIDRAAGERPAVRANGQAQIVVSTRCRLGARRVPNRLARPQHATLLPAEAGADPPEVPGQDVVHAARQMLDPPAGEHPDGRRRLARDGLGQFVQGGQALGQPEQHQFGIPEGVRSKAPGRHVRRPTCSAARSPPVRRSASHGSARPSPPRSGRQSGRQCARHVVHRDRVPISEPAGVVEFVQQDAVDRVLAGYSCLC